VAQRVAAGGPAGTYDQSPGVSASSCSARSVATLPIRKIRPFGARHAATHSQNARKYLLHAIYERIVVAGPTFCQPASHRPPTPTAWRSRSRRLLWRPRQDLNLRPAA
jgi:hypothetical protein